MSREIEPETECAPAICAWDAEQCREYREFALRQEITEFANLYGWQQAWALMWSATVASEYREGEVLS